MTCLNITIYSISLEVIVCVHKPDVQLEAVVYTTSNTYTRNTGYVGTFSFSR